MLKWLWHRILYGAYPTKFDKRCFEMYKQGLVDGNLRKIEIEGLLINIGVGAAKAIEDAAKEGVYRGAEEGLKYAVEQIMEAIDFDMLYQLRKEKEK